MKHLAAHPTVPLVDPPQAVARVVSRATTCRLLARLHGVALGGGAGGDPRQQKLPQQQPPQPGRYRLAAPRFALAPEGLTADTALAVEAALLAAGAGRALWPLIVKPEVACGPGDSHLLTVLLDRPTALALPTPRTTATSAAAATAASGRGEASGNPDDGHGRWLGRCSVVQE